MYIFSFFALRHYITISFLSIASTHPYFSRPPLFLETALLATIFLPFPSFFFLHSRHHETRLPPGFTLSVIQYRLAFFLTFTLPFFPTLLPSFRVSRFPSLLRYPSGRSTLFSDSHQLFLDAALPTEVRGALFPTPAGVQPEVLACAARPSIYFSSPTPARLGIYLLPFPCHTLRAYGCVHTTHCYRDEMKRETRGEREQTKLR